MNLGLFNELLEALERVGQHIMAAARLPKKRRAELLEVLSDTYEMLDRVLLMVIGRIGRVLDRAERGAREEFAVELSKLAWDSEWLDATREMSISSGLRRMHAELRRAPSRLLSRAAVDDWDALKELMERTMDDEGGLAEEIGRMLMTLSASGSQASASDEDFSRAQNALSDARSSLENERRRLIRAEVKIYDVL